MEGIVAVIRVPRTLGSRVSSDVPSRAICTTSVIWGGRVCTTSLLSDDENDNILPSSASNISVSVQKRLSRSSWRTSRAMHMRKEGTESLFSTSLLLAALKA